MLFRSLEDEVRAGRFREDLYYRIAGITLRMPALRERPGDIVPIARHLLDEVAAELGRPGVSLADEALRCLVAYPWPGNIRELRNEIARAVALSDAERIGPESLSLALRQGRSALATAGGADAALAMPASGTLQERLDALEAMVLREALMRHRWNKTRVAAELGLSRVGLRAKLQRLGLDGRVASTAGAAEIGRAHV